MAHTKATVCKRVEEGVQTNPRLPTSTPPMKVKMGKVPHYSKAMRKVEKPVKRKFRPGTRSLQEICQFQKSMELLVPELVFLTVIQEILQKEHPWHHVQVGAVSALHEAAEAYLIRLLRKPIFVQYMPREWRSLQKICG